MAHIEVNLNRLGQASDRVSEYLSAHRRKVREMDQAISRAGTEWQGKDAQAAGSAWRDMKSSGSTSDRMQDALRAYGRNLRQAQVLYEDAQARAYNRFWSL